MLVLFIESFEEDRFWDEAGIADLHLPCFQGEPHSFERFPMFWERRQVVGFVGVCQKVVQFFDWFAGAEPKGLNGV